MFDCLRHVAFTSLLSFSCVLLYVCVCVCVSVCVCCVVNIPNMLPGLVPTTHLALWWETLIISSPMCMQLSEKTSGERRGCGGAVDAGTSPLCQKKPLFFWPRGKVSPKYPPLRALGYFQFTVSVCSFLMYCSLCQLTKWSVRTIVCWLFGRNPYGAAFLKCVSFAHAQVSPNCYAFIMRSGWMTARLKS